MKNKLLRAIAWIIYLRLVKDYEVDERHKPSNWTEADVLIYKQAVKDLNIKT